MKKERRINFVNVAKSESIDLCKLMCLILDGVLMEEPISKEEQPLQTVA